MIRINLLPVRAARKKETLKQQLIVAGVLFVIVMIVLILTDRTQENKMQKVQAQIKQNEAEVARLKTVIGEVDKLKSRKKALEDKTRVIEKLKSNRNGPVRLMDELSSVIPPKAWLLSMDQSPAMVQMKCQAVNEEVISDFMINLEKSPCFGEVKLTEIRNVGSGGNPKKDFGLSAKFTLPCPVAPVAP